MSILKFVSHNRVRQHPKFATDRRQRCANFRVPGTRGLLARFALSCAGERSSKTIARVDPRIPLRMAWQGRANLSEMAGTTLAAYGGSLAMTNMGRYEREAL